MPLLDLGSPGASFFLRATASLGLLLTVMGLNCFGPVFSLPVIDAARFGSLLLLQSFVCLGFVLFAFDINHLELSLFLQAISCLDVSFLAFSMAFLDSSIPVLDPAQLGVLVLLHALACPEPVPSTFGSSSLGLSPMALDLGSLGFLLMARSVSHTGPVFSAFALANLDVPLLVLDPVLPEMSLPPHSFQCSDSLSFLHGASHLDSLMLPFDFAVLEALPFLRSPAYLGSVSSAFSFSRVGFLILVPDTSQLGSPLFPQAFGQLGLPLLLFGRGSLDTSLLVSDSLGLDLFIFLHRLSHLGLPPMAFCIACFGLSPPVPDFAELESLLPSRGLARAGPVVLVLGIV